METAAAPAPRVQALADAGVPRLPAQYIQPPDLRAGPSLSTSLTPSRPRRGLLGRRCYHNRRGRPRVRRVGRLSRRQPRVPAGAARRHAGRRVGLLLRAHGGEAPVPRTCPVARLRPRIQVNLFSHLWY